MNNKLESFTIFDIKAKAFLQPFFSMNIDTAKRDFSKAVNGDGQFAQFAEDYALYHTGSFDQAEGTWETYDSPQHLCNAITLRTNPVAMPLPMAISDAVSQPEGFHMTNGKA